MTLLNLIGNTPIADLSSLSKSGTKIYAKDESKNPGGSIKDRIAKFMIEIAEETGELKPGDRIVEATSGNTGISLSMVAKEKGYKMIVVIPRNMSPERMEGEKYSAKGDIWSLGLVIVEMMTGVFACNASAIC